MTGLDKFKRSKEMKEEILSILKRPWTEPMLIADIAREVKTDVGTAKAKVNEILLNKEVSGIRTKKVGTMTLLMKG